MDQNSKDEANGTQRIDADVKDAKKPQECNENNGRTDAR